MRSTEKSSYQEHIRSVLQNYPAYHEVFYAVKTFGGPSLYFHRRALEMARGDFERCLEYIYAVLTSWGMHRMGPGGSKMQDFEVFRTSMLPLRDKIETAKAIQVEAITGADWALLREIFSGIRIMASETLLVGNSKVLAHLVPNIIPPVDREYTLKFLQGYGHIRNGMDQEWSMLRRIVQHFFLPVATDAGFRKQASEWMADQALFPWDTSLLKVVDNVLIGAVKAKKAAGVLPDTEEEETNP